MAERNNDAAKELSDLHIGDDAEVVNDGSEDDSDDMDEDENDDDDVDREYDRRMFGIYQSLPVDDGAEHDEEDEAAMYLRRVRDEANGLPDVFCSSIDPNRYNDRRTPQLPHGAMDGGTDMAPCLDCARPSMTWVLDTARGFHAARQHVRRCRDTIWQHDGQVTVSVAEKQQWMNRMLQPPADGDTKGFMRTIAQLDQISTTRLLRWLIDNLSTAAASSTSHDDVMSQRHVNWLSALLTCLQMPLHADVASMLRELLRTCCRLRSAVQDGNDACLPKLNLFVVLCGAYFGQSEEYAGKLDVEPG